MERSLHIHAVNEVRREWMGTQSNVGLMGGIEMRSYCCDFEHVAEPQPHRRIIIAVP
jgi:hypothetical protein